MVYQAPMASIQKTKTGHFVKLNKPIQFRLRGHPEAKMFTKNGFTRYIHELSESEIEQIQAVEAKLAVPLAAADKHLKAEYILKSIISEQRTKVEYDDEDDEPSDEAKAPAQVVFLTVPKAALQKLRSRAVSKVNIRASVRGMNLTTSAIHGNSAFLDIISEFDVTESEETDLDLEEVDRDDEGTEASNDE